MDGEPNMNPGYRFRGGGRWGPCGPWHPPGWGWQTPPGYPYPAPPEPQWTREDELRMLEEDRQALENELDALRRRIAELESDAGEGS